MSYYKMLNNLVHTQTQRDNTEIKRFVTTQGMLGRSPRVWFNFIRFP